MNKKKKLEYLDPRFFKGIAHRGYHNEEFTENGIKAFQHAIDNDLAIEFDIHLTKDKRFVVMHDYSLKRTTGKEGIIEEMTLQDIKENYRLLDGGEILTLEELLSFVDERVPLIIELKHYKKNAKEVGKEFVKAIKGKIRDKSKFLLISFHPFCLTSARKIGLLRQLLIAESDQYTWHFRHLCGGDIDVEQILLKQKKYQKYHKRYMVNVWTIRNEEELKNALPYVDMVTFQDFSHEIVQKYLIK